LVAFLLVLPHAAWGGLCDVAWDGDKLSAAVAGRPFELRVSLRYEGELTEVSAGEIQAFSEAKERITRVAGISPHYLICSGEPNAFATATEDGDLVVVTIGMLQFAAGDRDMAAAVIGHELAHHTLGHRSAAATRDTIIELAGLFAGIALDSKLERRNPRLSGLGLDLAHVGGVLIASKFDRDQEREADRVGFEYMVAAAFNPNGALNLAERMNEAGLGGAGLFFDSHPGWPERAAQFRALIAASPEAQALVARGGTPARASVKSTGANLSSAALAPTYTTTGAQKSYADGLAAARAKDIDGAVRHFRVASDAGYAPAQLVLGYLYSRGRGVPLDDAEAVRLFRLAADQGNASAQASLGSMYETGHGVKQDDSEAVRLFRLSAGQGSAQGRANLGIMFMSGRGGLPKDSIEAVTLFRLSAQQGNAMAQNNLGVAFELGLGGLDKDLDQAVAWYNKAAAQGMPLAISHLKRLGRM
jgi:TPR repeat protein